MLGKVLLWFFLGVLLLFALALVLPVVLYAEYKDGEFTLKVRILFVKIKLFPQKEKNKAQKPPKKAKAKKGTSKPEEEETEKPTPTLEQRLEMVQRLVFSASPALKFIFKHLHIRDVVLVLPVQGSDAADTALQFGRIQGIVFGIYAALQNFTRITYRKLVLLPDFMGQYGEALNFSCKVKASPGIMLIAAIIALRRYIKYGQDRKRNYRMAGQKMLEERRRRAAKARAAKQPKPPAAPTAGQAPVTAGRHEDTQQDI